MAKFYGFVEEVRNLGGIKFIKLHTRDRDYQITAHKDRVSLEVFKLIDELTRQSAIEVEGELVRNPEAPSGEEIIPKSIRILQKSATPLPLDPSGKTSAEMDTRLDWRPLDLRNRKVTAIFKIQSKLVEGMEEWLVTNGFIKVFTPCLIGAASEGGAEVFKVPYFEKEAYLRQDPQLHRELAIIGGLEKIYDLGPNWRAELSHTPRHLCEHRAMAVEIAFIKDERDTMRVQEQLVVAGIKKVLKECGYELDVLGIDIKVPRTPFPELTFPKIYEILEEMGKKIPFGEDYDRESEKLLWQYVKEKYKTDWFFVNRFPFAVKPFYVMRVDEEPRWARSVDLLFKGLELSSGGQREHRYEKLVEQVKEKGISMESVEWFLRYFKYGAPPMGGFAIGIERLTMQLLDLKNIKEATLFPRTPERLLP